MSPFCSFGYAWLLRGPGLTSSMEQDLPKTTEKEAAEIQAEHALSPL